MRNENETYYSELGSIESALWKLNDKLQTLIDMIDPIVPKCSCGKPLKKCMEENGVFNE